MITILMALLIAATALFAVLVVVGARTEAPWRRLDAQAPNRPAAFTRCVMGVYVRKPAQTGDQADAERLAGLRGRR